MFLSIVIPLFNEADRIVSTLDRIYNYFLKSNFSFEIITIDDGSNDNTLEVIKNFSKKLPSSINFTVLENKKNRGKGYSIRKGILAAEGQYVLFSDADLSTPIEECENLLKYIQHGYNIAIASRGLKDSNIVIRQARIREYMGKIFNFFIRRITKLEFMDTQCGFKCFDRYSVEKIFPLLEVNDFSFDIEILYLANKFGLKIKEVPVTWRNSKSSKVSIFKDPIKMLLSVCRVKRIHLNS